MKDLFGNEVKFPLPDAHASPLKGRKLKTGYPAKPGGGPEGETCRTCKHKRRYSSGTKAWYKCGLCPIKGHLATDIKLKSPACFYWEKEENG